MLTVETDMSLANRHRLLSDYVIDGKEGMKYSYKLKDLSKDAL